jgi:hypothetical protein
MMKYEPLEKHLRSSPRRDLSMKFNEIERLIGAKLPASARRHPAWWSNTPTNNVATNAWLRSGFKTANVSIADERVVFRPSAPDIGEKRTEKNKGRFSLFGRMAGTVRIHPDVDLTEPVGGAWGTSWDEKDTGR